MNRPNITIRNKTDAAAIGALVAVVLLSAIFFAVFLGHNSSTEDLNNNQRFRAICEFQGGHTVVDGSERYCINKNQIILIDLDK
jgi:hypothetical protein